MKTHLLTYKDADRMRHTLRVRIMNDNGIVATVIAGPPWAQYLITGVALVRLKELKRERTQDER